MKSKFKILIVDDEVLIAEYLKDILISYGYVELALAHNKMQAMKKAEEFVPDLILLDIRMKSETEGIEIAEEINSRYKIPFIYITAHSDKEIIARAVKTKPVGYITKPFKSIDIYAAVHVVESCKEEPGEKFLILKDGYANVKVAVDEILYAQSDDNYIHIYTISKKYVVRNSMEWFGENTSKKMFYRTHRSFIVNTTKITKTTTKSVYIGEIEIPLARGNQIKLS